MIRQHGEVDRLPLESFQYRRDDLGIEIGNRPHLEFQISEVRTLVDRLDVQIDQIMIDERGESVPVHQGETVLVPAAAQSLRMTPDGTVKLLTSWID